MNVAVLQQTLDKLGAVRCGSALVGRCGLCQIDEDNVEDYKLQLRCGEQYPLIVFCVRCGFPKPQTEAERKHNRSLSRQIFAAAGCDLNAVFTKMDVEQIQQLWSSVVVEGGVPNTDDDSGRADDGILHLTYSSLLDRLQLTDQHRRWLSKRGLDADWAFDVGYRSTGTETQWEDRHTEGVPGLANRRWLIRPDSILIPCRNRQHRICALKQRLFGERSRMRLVSHSECKAANILHWPVGSSLVSQQPLWLSEGERKGDILHRQFEQPVVALPGTGMWSRCIGLGVEAGAVVLAMDNDDAGRICCGRIGRALTDRGVAVSVCRWADGKGVDDAIRLGQSLELVDWADVAEEYEQKVEENKMTHPPTKNSLLPTSTLKDWEIINYVRQNGPLLRTELRAFQPTVSQFIREGRLKMWKTEKGQMVQANE